MAKPNRALKLAIWDSALTQEDVAERADIHVSQMSRIVNGRRQPSDEEQKAIARVLKRKPAELFPEPEERAS